MSDVVTLKHAPIAGTPRISVLAQIMMAAHFVQKGVLDALTGKDGYRKLSLTYVDYISRLALRDHAPGELAEALGVSKQVCSKVIRELESQNFIERRPNPADNRSALISLSAHGRRLTQDGREAADAILRQVEDGIGPDVLKKLTAVLEKLCAGLGLRILALDPALAPSRLNLLLPQLADYGRRRMGEAIRAAGFDPIGSSAGDIFALINGGVSQIRDLAAIHGVSKQAVAMAAAELERLDYITRQPDPADARQLFLRLSPRGERLVATGRESELTIEDSFRTLLDPREFALLQDSMASWYANITDRYDPARVLRHKIQQISEQLLTELGPAGARALAQHLITLTRGKL